MSAADVTPIPLKMILCDPTPLHPAVSERPLKVITCKQTGRSYATRGSFHTSHPEDYEVRVVEPSR